MKSLASVANWLSARDEEIKSSIPLNIPETSKGCDAHDNVETIVKTANAAEPRQRQMITFRERRGILTELSDSELMKRYGLDLAGIVYVTHLVRDTLTSRTTFSSSYFN